MIRYALPLTTLALWTSLIAPANCQQNAAPDASTAKPDMVLQLGHADLINEIALSGDGSRLASAGDDRTVKIWDTATGELRQTLPRESLAIRSVDFSPDGALLASLSGSSDMPSSFDEGALRLWDVRSGALVKSLPVPLLKDAVVNPKRLRFSPDGTTLAVLYSTEFGEGPVPKCILQLWDVQTAKLRHSFAPALKDPAGLVFGPGGKTLALSGSKGPVQLINVATGQLVRSYKGNGEGAWGLAVSRDGKMLAAGCITAEHMSAMTTTFVWDFATGKVKRKFMQAGVVVALQFLPDNKTIIANGGMLGGAELKYWDVSTGRETRSVLGLSDSFVPLTLSADGRVLATAGFAGVGAARDMREVNTYIGDVQLWDARNLKLQRVMRGYRQPVEQIAFSTATNLMALASHGEQRYRGYAPRTPSVLLWNLTDGSLQAAFPGIGTTGFNKEGTTVTVMDTALVTRSQMVTGRDGKERPEKYQTPEPILVERDVRPGSASGRQLRISKSASDNSERSPDGRTKVSVSVDQDPNDPTSYWGTIKLFNLATGKLVRKWRLPGVADADYSPDGKLLATMDTSLDTQNGTNAIQLWDATTGQLKHKLGITGKALKGNEQLKDHIKTLMFSPDGKSIIARNYSGILVWNVATGQLTLAIETSISLGDKIGGPGELTAPLALSADGALLATESDTNGVNIWSAKTGACLRELKGHASNILTLAFTPDGRKVVSGSNDNTLKCWDVKTGRLLVTLQILGTEPGKSGRDAVRWIAFAPDGSFEASANAAPLVRWREGERLRPFTDFSATYQRAGVLRAAFATE